MNQLCGAESCPINVRVTFVPQRTTSGGPEGRRVAFENPHPSAASPYNVRFTGLGSSRIRIVPVMVFGCIPQRYVQVPGCIAGKLNSPTTFPGTLKSREAGSPTETVRSLL